MQQYFGWISYQYYVISCAERFHEKWPWKFITFTCRSLDSFTGVYVTTNNCFFFFFIQKIVFLIYMNFILLPISSNIDFTKLTTQFQFLTKKRSFTYEAYEVWTKLIAFDTSEQKISIATNNNTAELDHDFVLRAYNRLENTHISVQRWEFIE